MFCVKRAASLVQRPGARAWKLPISPRKSGNFAPCQQLRPLPRVLEGMRECAMQPQMVVTLTPLLRYEIFWTSCRCPHMKLRVPSFSNSCSCPSTACMPTCPSDSRSGVTSCACDCLVHGAASRLHRRRQHHLHPHLRERCL